MLSYKRQQMLSKLQSQDLHYRQMKQLQAALMESRRDDEAQQLILRHKLKSHNAKFEKNHTPGPGSYDIKPITKGGVKIGTGNPKGYMEWAQYNGVRLPGPGYYEPHPIPDGHMPTFGNSAGSDMDYAIRHANDTPGPATYGDITYVSDTPSSSMGGQSITQTDVDVKCKLAAETPAPGETLRVNEPDRLTVRQMRKMLTDEKQKWATMSVKKKKQMSKPSLVESTMSPSGKNLAADLQTALPPNEDAIETEPLASDTVL